ncbi:MAG: rhodanese-like domain-containing protein [Flavobacteriales bacterium]|jgi:phage shock protein E|nr:rhodanese-like domain-containing protein [Flavobacteriales bacterium]|tara:strand:+ start:445 stop:771 length:327 start_codon:yes stop_codon:yes gene_type:complete
MLKSILNLLGFGPKADYYDLVVNHHAIVVDVRSKGEFKSGHIEGSLNIPVEGLRKNIGKLEGKQETPIITCCASGMRSATAKGILKAKGFKVVHNGGAWLSLDGKLHK